MDFQNRVGSKFGGGGVMSESSANADRRERLRKLALETVDLNKDPYFMVSSLSHDYYINFICSHVFRFKCILFLRTLKNLRETIWGSTSASCA